MRWTCGHETVLCFGFCKFINQAVHLEMSQEKWNPVVEKTHIW
jgi:hypothetical protein